MANLTQRLKQLRQEKNITQRALADIVGLSNSGYQYIEGMQKQPTLNNLLALADYFGVSLDYLVGRTDNPEINK